MQKKISETGQRSTTRDGNNTMKADIKCLGIVKDLWFLFFLPIIYLYVFLFIIISNNLSVCLSLSPSYTTSTFIVSTTALVQMIKHTIHLVLTIIFSFLGAYKDTHILEDFQQNYLDMFMSKNESVKLPNRPTLPQRNTLPPLVANLGSFLFVFLFIQSITSSKCLSDFPLPLHLHLSYPNIQPKLT